MPSRADVAVAPASPVVRVSDSALRAVGGALQVLGVVSIALLLWHALTPASRAGARLRVTRDARAADIAGALQRAAVDTVQLTLDVAPDARIRAVIRAMRASGRAVTLDARAPLRSIAVSVDERWRVPGGTRVQIAAADSQRVALRDAAGLIDSLTVPSDGVRRETGPAAGALSATGVDARAAVVAVRADSAGAERVLVLGDASWESRFLIAALEEAGWLVDASLSMAPHVTVTQGGTRGLSSARHAIAVVLPGASTAALTGLPAFVRGGGGVVIVGEAARAAGVRGLLAGSPGRAVDGELGAERSDAPRHALELVPIAALHEGSVPIESRDTQLAVAARRIGAGRVVQVGYTNSWLWRMAGDENAVEAHRRWWSTLLAGVMPQRAAPVAALSPMDDTLDAAPVAAVARDVGLPGIAAMQAEALPSVPWIAQRSPRVLLALALIGLTGAWTLRRWRGLV
jgi:hypothetical protein